VFVMNCMKGLEACVDAGVANRGCVSRAAVGDVVAAPGDEEDDDSDDDVDDDDDVDIDSDEATDVDGDVDTDEDALVNAGDGVEIMFCNI